MRTIFFLLSFIYFTVFILSCKSNSTRDLYEFLSICQDEFFLDHGVQASEKLIEFEQFLIEEGHLVDVSGKSYIVLLRQLAKKTYFDPPLKKENFNNALLYKNPPNLYQCVETTYGIDSIQLALLPYHHVAEQVAEYLTSDEEVMVQGIFKIYSEQLSSNELEQPYIRETVLLLLYRWYFSSKYDRTLMIPEKSFEDVQTEKEAG